MHVAKNSIYEKSDTRELKTRINRWHIRIPFNELEVRQRTLSNHVRH
jgi:hypothetical protein